MNTKQSNSVEEIRNEFQKLSEKSHEEKVEHRAQMLSYIFLSEAQKAMDRKGWTRKQLADEIGTSANYLTQIFRGDRILNFKMVAKIEYALDLKYGIYEESNQRIEMKESGLFNDEFQSVADNEPTEEKTALEWLEDLPDGYRERALENYDYMYDGIYPIGGLSDAILDSFHWRSTPEGHKFWKTVYEWALGYVELPPLLDKDK